MNREMSGVQALERAAPSLPMKPGKTERREYDTSATAPSA